MAIVEYLLNEPKVKNVYYPGIKGTNSYEICKKQEQHILKHTRLILFAESLGGVETLLTYPVTQTHADVPEEIRLANGITDRVLRMSTGIEDKEDLIEDLKFAIDSYDGYKGLYI